MNFNEFQNIVSRERLLRYLEACNGDKEKALKLYQANIRVSLEMFAVVGAFEIALRNAINKIMSDLYGSEWLKDAVMPGGFFDIPQCNEHAVIIRNAYNKLNNSHSYEHNRLLTKMEFGIWKYMFSSPQYRASGRVLLRVFPDKPISTRFRQYNNTTIFNELDHINSLRNRIAHHEPICFPTGRSEISTYYINWIYSKLSTLFSWMRINIDDYIYDNSKLFSAIEEIELMQN